MKKTITLFLFLFAISLQIFAQDRTITGTVTSSKDKSTIPGVTISVPGTTTATSTDIDGKYSIIVGAGVTKLHVSGVGFKTKDVDVTASNELNIEVEEDVLKLDEVVVTALGVKKEKKAVGYSAQTVSSDQLAKSGTGNVLGELGGKVSGLNVINSSGNPGGGTYINLRGVTSLTGSNQPLFVVDGIPLDNSINNYDPTNAGFQASGAEGNTTGGVNPDNRGIDINPDDIATVTVLKGPAATALYGINAASGAVVITTKRGVGIAGKKGPIVTFTTSTSWDKVSNLPARQQKYSQGNNGVYQGPTTGRSFSWGASVDSLAYNGITNEWDPNGDIVRYDDPTAVRRVNIYDPYDFFQTGHTYDNNVSISGGNENSGFRLSVGNLHQTGIIPLSDYTKSTFNLSGQSNLTKRLTASATITYTKSKSAKTQQGSNTSGVMLGLLRTPITFDNSYGHTDDGESYSEAYVQPNGVQRNYRGGGGYDNPYWTVNRNPFSQDVDRVFGSGQVDYKLMSWATITYRLGGDVYAQNSKNGYDIYSRAFPAGALYLVDYSNRQYNSDIILNLTKKFNDKMNGSLLLGQNYFTQTSSNKLMQGNGFVIPAYFDLSNSTSFFTSESKTRKRTSAWYGQAQLDYASQIYLNVTGRSETSSTLSPDHNTFFYPSASLSWIFTETFKMADNKILPYGKLRLSYAQVGKDAPTQGTRTYYTSAAFNDGFTSGLVFPIDGNVGYGITSSIAVLGNPDLKPEKTNSVEGGLDLTFLQNRISLEATLYTQKTTDGIFTVPISSATGWPSVLDNAAELTNKGIELSLNLTPVKLANGFKWDIGLNWSKNKNKVTKLYKGVDNLFIAGFENGAIYAVEGEQFGSIYGSTYVHADPNDDSSPLLINDDVNDPGYGAPITGDQNKIIGNINPDWIGSITTSVSYKGITLAGQLDIRHGGDIWNGTRGAMSYFGVSGETENRGETKVFDGVTGHLNADGNVVHYDVDGVTELAGAGGANTEVATLNQYYWQNIGSSFVGPASPSVEDGSFVRLKQVSLSYSFPEKMLGKRITNLSISIFANNAKLWTKYTGVDPETSLSGPANGQGLDYFNSPGSKSYGVRLAVGF